MCEENLNPFPILFPTQGFFCLYLFLSVLVMPQTRTFLLLTAEQEDFYSGHLGADKRRGSRRFLHREWVTVQRCG